MGRRLSLPLRSDADDEALPTLDAMRKRLGGRIVAAPSIATPWGVVAIGAPVEVAGNRARVGILIAVEGTVADVYHTGGIVRRTDGVAIVPHDGAAPPDLVDIASSASVFARLAEGQPVEVEREGELVRGELVEKCRYGALVRVEGDRVLAVGFRKIRPPRNDALAN